MAAGAGARANRGASVGTTAGAGARANRGASVGTTAGAGARATRGASVGTTAGAGANVGFAWQRPRNKVLAWEESFDLNKVKQYGYRIKIKRVCQGPFIESVCPHLSVLLQTHRPSRVT